MTTTEALQLLERFKDGGVDGDEVLHTLGRRTASTRVTGVYPAFDVTPPRFVSAVVTDRGRFAPNDVASYFTGAGR